MTKRTTLPQSAHHVMIYAEDWEFAKDYWSTHGNKRLGPSGAIREIFHKYVKALKAKQEMQMDGDL